ncbi:MAG: DNA mismatch repair protein MutS [Gammaproteobacteria bacterium]|nr:DNA mismatch repair protein MutS [Gammaproteobacteria bacterium]
MSDEELPDESERALFRAAVADCTPLRHDRARPSASPPAPDPRMRSADERRVMEESMRAPLDPAEQETGAELSYARAGAQHRLLRKLRRGHFATEAELDLHGLRVGEARAALDRFLGECRARGLRCVRIVHGKGQGSPEGRPVLKQKVAGWLRLRAGVLAYCSARPVDGGTGALYVLLRR